MSLVFTKLAKISAKWYLMNIKKGDAVHPGPRQQKELP
jgi:hypothetical protein